MSRMRRATATLARATLIAVLALGTPPPDPGSAARAQTAPAAAPEAPRDAAVWARQQFPEGVPWAEARALDAHGVERLAALLRDPAEGEAHANVVMALGIHGHPTAWPALSEFAARAPRGEVSSAAYRARLALPIAMGHLARADPRALARLLARVRGGPTEPGWSHRGLRGDRLGRLLWRTAVTGLALSGTHAAAAEIAQRLGAGAPDAETGRHLEASRRLCERVAREGAAAVVGGERPDSTP